MRDAFQVAALGAGLLFAGTTHAAEVSMQAFAFVPATLNVQKGTTVTWMNQDSVPHSVTAADGSFDSGPVPPGKTFAWVVREDRAIEYHCIFHPSMTGSLNASQP